MQEFVLKVLDVFFFCFHTVLILFNSFGWIIPRWRLANLIVLSLTAFSWFILGIWYGWGYCYCTDWHWQVREMMGHHDMSPSYIHYLIFRITGIDFSVSMVDSTTVVVFFSSFFISIYLNMRNWMQKKRTHLLNDKFS